MNNHWLCFLRYVRLEFSFREEADGENETKLNRDISKGGT